MTKAFENNENRCKKNGKTKTTTNKQTNFLVALSWEHQGVVRSMVVRGYATGPLMVAGPNPAAAVSYWALNQRRHQPNGTGPHLDRTKAAESRSLGWVDDFARHDCLTADGLVRANWCTRECRCWTSVSVTCALWRKRANGVWWVDSVHRTWLSVSWWAEQGELMYCVN